MQITRGILTKAQKVVLYGVEGIGKSTFAAQFPDPLFIDTEGSTDHMDVARLDKPTSWTMLLQQIEFVKQNKPCKTLVIDTVDWAERQAIDHVCAKAKKSSITEFGYGEGFIRLEEEIGRFLNRLSDLIEIGINVVLTAHAKITKFEQPDEFGAYDRWELKLGNKTTAKTAALVKEWAAMLLFANYKTNVVAANDKATKFKGEGKARVMYASHHAAWDAKNRHGLPDELPFDFAHIAHCFQREEITATLDKITVTDKAEVAEMVKDHFVQVAEEAIAAAPETVPEAKAELPRALLDLMKVNEVREDEIQEAVASRGYYPIDTPIANYDSEFIDGVLIGAWEQVFGMIEAIRDKELPF